MRLEIIIDRAKATGLPLAKDAFRETKENPLPVPPYLVYIVPQVVGRGSDERILLHEIHAALELYTDKVADGSLEKEIEEKVLFDVDYTKYQDTIESEDMVQTAYEFTIYEKVRKNGINSLDMGLFITGQSAADSAAEPEIETVEVPAKGILIQDNRIDTLDNQRFKDYEQKYTCCVDATQGRSLEELAHSIYMWLYAPGIEYSRLYDTYNTERYRLAYINSNASVSELAKRLLGEIEITFMCKAYERRLNGDKTITLTKAATIYNTEGFTATPYIKITGSGGITLYINNRAHTFKDVNEYIEIDGEIMNAYKGDLLQNSKMVTELFPKLTAGANNISWAGNVTKVEIIPRWCRL